MLSKKIFIHQVHDLKVTHVPFSETFLWPFVTDIQIFRNFLLRDDIFCRARIFFSVSTFFPEPKNSGPSVYCIRSVFSVLRRFRSHYFAPKFSVQNRFKILIKWFEIVQILPQWTVFFRKAWMSWSTNGSIQQFITKISSKFFSFTWLLSLR